MPNILGGVQWCELEAQSKALRGIWDADGNRMCSLALRARVSCVPLLAISSVPTFALHMSREQCPPAQFRISVAKRLGSGESYRVSLPVLSVDYRALQDSVR